MLRMPRSSTTSKRMVLKTGSFTVVLASSSRAMQSLQVSKVTFEVAWLSESQILSPISHDAFALYNVCSPKGRAELVSECRLVLE